MPEVHKELAKLSTGTAKERSISSKIQEALNIAPKKGTYIEPSEFEKYRASRRYSDIETAAIYARTHTGYLSGSGASVEDLRDAITLLNLHKKVENKELTKRQAINIAEKENIDISEVINDPTRFDDFLYNSDQAFSMDELNKIHRNAAIAIDKPMYIVKSPYMTGANYLKGESSHLVSASIVDPYKPVAKAYDNKIGTMVKLPKGTKVTFTDNEGEVVVELGELKNNRALDMLKYSRKIHEAKKQLKAVGISVPTIAAWLNINGGK